MIPLTADATLLVGPTQEPLDLDEVKRVLRFTATSEDTLIDTWIAAARQYFEDQTSRQVLAALRQDTFAAFPAGGVIELSHPPLLSVVSVTYDDDEGPQLLDAADYAVVSQAGGSPSTVTEPFGPRGQIVLHGTSTWPTPSDRAGVVRVQFWAGYGATPGDVPEIVKACLYDLVRYFHSRPDGDLPLGTQIMLRMFRQSAIPQIAMARA